jgi:hypothetical protein
MWLAWLCEDGINTGFPTRASLFCWVKGELVTILLPGDLAFLDMEGLSLRS